MLVVIGWVITVTQASTKMLTVKSFNLTIHYKEHETENYNCNTAVIATAECP